jgi:membrane fusion protein (multidrug efflux system)
VDEGQAVRKGQLLFRINDEEARLSLDKARAALKSAQANARIAAVELNRVRALVDKKVVSPSELELMKARLEAEDAKAEEAKATCNEAAALLSYTAIYAPFDGVIDRLPLKEGSLIGKGSLLTTISDNHAMYAYFDLSETEYLKLVRNSDSSHVFDKVNLVLSDGTMYRHTGTVLPAESEIDEATGSIALRAVFANPDRLLKHGASGKLLISREVKDALLVPQKSVFEIQDRSYVYVTGPDNKVRLQHFEPAQRIGPYYVVASGLRSGERIVYEGVQSLRDGALIKPTPKTL